MDDEARKLFLELHRVIGDAYNRYLEAWTSYSDSDPPIGSQVAKNALEKVRRSLVAWCNAWERYATEALALAVDDPDERRYATGEGKVLFEQTVKGYAAYRAQMTRHGFAFSAEPSDRALGQSQLLLCRIAPALATRFWKEFLDANLPIAGFEDGRTCPGVVPPSSAAASRTPSSSTAGQLPDASPWSSSSTTMSSVATPDSSTSKLADSTSEGASLSKPSESPPSSSTEPTPTEPTSSAKRPGAPASGASTSDSSTTRSPVPPVESKPTGQPDAGTLPRDPPGPTQHPPKPKLNDEEPSKPTSNGDGGQPVHVSWPAFIAGAVLLIAAIGFAAAVSCPNKALALSLNVFLALGSALIVFGVVGIFTISVKMQGFIGGGAGGVLIVFFLLKPAVPLECTPPTPPLEMHIRVIEKGKSSKPIPRAAVSVLGQTTKPLTANAYGECVYPFTAARAGSQVEIWGSADGYVTSDPIKVTLDENTRPSVELEPAGEPVARAPDTGVADAGSTMPPPDANTKRGPDRGSRLARVDASTDPFADVKARVIQKLAAGTCKPKFREAGPAEAKELFASCQCGAALEVSVSTRFNAGIEDSGLSSNDFSSMVAACAR